MTTHSKWLRGAALSLALVFATTDLAVPEEAAEMQLEAKIALGPVAGRIDHMAVDAKREHLFVAELGNNSVGVVDLANGTVAHRIGGLSEPQGVAYLEATDTLYVANAGDGSVRMFRGSDHAATGQIGLGSDADNIRFDATDRRLLVGYGSGALAVIDPTANRVTGHFTLKAHPESFQIDSNSDRIFVNLPDAHAIAVLERTTGKPVAEWSMTDSANFAMALDREQPRLFAVFRRPAKLVSLSTQTGKPLAETPTCGDADDLFVDAKRQRIYVVCGEGFVDVFDAQDIRRRLAHIPTIEGARTALFVPERDRLYVAARAQGKEPAAIWVLRPAP